MELFSGAHENVTLYKMILPFVVSTEVHSDRLLSLPSLPLPKLAWEKSFLHSTEPRNKSSHTLRKRKDKTQPKLTSFCFELTVVVPTWDKK